MNYHILTLFPEMVTQGLSESILGRAAKKGLLSVNAVNIRDYTADRHKKVDDYPYGGGAGMLMQAQPVYDAGNPEQAAGGAAGQTGAHGVCDAAGSRVQPADGKGVRKGGRSYFPVRAL